MDGSGSKRQFSLPRESELRVEVEWGARSSVRLVSGTAELFGSELAVGQTVDCSEGSKVAVFTYHGAVVEMEGSPKLPEVLYVADETPMVSYNSLHGILNVRRMEAKQQNGKGPRVLVVGAADSGKSTACRILTNYAARNRWQPSIVDLDVSLPSLSAPGVVAAACIEEPAEAGAGYPQESPMMLYFGHTEPSVAPDLYRASISSLATVIARHLDGNPHAAHSGIIVDSMAWIDTQGYQSILHAIEAFGIDLVLVLSQERLYSQLQAAFGSAGKEGSERSEGGRGEKRRVEVVKMPRSGGVVQRDAAFRQKARQAILKKYFYGPDASLNPRFWSTDFDSLKIFRVHSGHTAPLSALPIGAQPSADPLRLTAVPISRELLHTVAAVSWAKEESEILQSNIAGFVSITEVDVAGKTLKLLMPNPGPPPSRILLVGSISWVE